MNPAADAKRLLNDPDHLRRKADYIESLMIPGTRSTMNEIRMNRAAELRYRAEQIEASR